MVPEPLARRVPDIAAWDCADALLKSLSMRTTIDVDKTTLGFVASLKIRTLMEKFYESPEDSSPLESIEELMKALEPLALPFDLWKAQNLLFFTGKQLAVEMRARAEGGDEAAIKWVERFDSLSNYLKVRSA